jgi:hypothetical protein
LKSGAIQTTVDKLNTYWGTSIYSVITYGGSADTWGRGWTPAEIKDPSFAFVLGVKSANTTATVASVDYVGVKVFYTAPSSVALSSSSNSSNFGSPVTLTATVTGSDVTPIGNITFKDGITSLGNAVALVGGTASFTTSSLSVGNHSITAEYSSGNYDNSTSTPLNQSIVSLADLTAYNAALAAVNQADYTVASWTAYQTVVTANVMTVANTQTEVDAATLAITNAQGNLITVVSDANLTTAKNAAAALNSANYVDFSAVITALALPETTNAEMITKANAINAAIAGLVLKSDLTAYNAALAAVVQADYTPVSWTTYQTVVAVNVVTTSNTQAQVDTATANIVTAQGNLVTLAAQLAIDQAAALVVINQITALPVPVTLADSANVSAARVAYNALTIDQRALVTNLAILTAAETRITALQIEAALLAINVAPNGPDLVAAILANASVLGLNITGFNALSYSNQVLAVTSNYPGGFTISPILSIYFDSVSFLQSELNLAVLNQNNKLLGVAAINAANATTMESVIVANATLLGITPLSSISNPALSVAGKNLVIQAMIGKSFVTVSDVQVAYNTATAIGQVNSITTFSAMKTYLDNSSNYPKFGINYNVWYSYRYTPTSYTYRDTIATAMLNQAFITANDVKTAFDSAVNTSLTQVNVATIVIAETSTTSINGYFVYSLYPTILGIDVTAYNLLSASGRSLVNGVITALTTGTAATIKTTFDLNVAIQEINEATASTMGAMIVKNAVTLGLNLTNYNALIDKAPVYIALLPTNFTSSTQIQTGFNTAVSNQMAVEAATAAVVTAETTRTQADISIAQALVTALPNGAVKTALQARLNALDITAPVIVPSVNPTPNAAGWNNSDVTITWSVTDPESAITNQTGCDTTTVTTDTTGTVYTCSATSTGGTNSNSVTIKLDKSLPSDPAPAATVASPTNQNALTWTWTAVVDTVSGIQNYLWNLWNNSVFVRSGTTNTNSVTINTSGEGNYSLDVQSQDNAGNKSGVVASATTTVDTTAPTTPVLTFPNNNEQLNTHNFTFQWNASSDVSSLTYEWEFSYINTLKTDGSFTNRSGYHNNLPTSIYSPGTPDNRYYWHVRAIDKAGNAGQWSDVWNVVIDTVAPVITGVSNGQSSSVPLTPAITDTNAFTATLNGNAFTSGTVVPAVGSYTLVATDVAGNATTVNFTIIQADQNITFGTLADKTYGDANFGVSATASSGLDVSFTATGDCNISGSTVNITGAGSCTITAKQAGNGSFNPAPDVSQTFTIAKASSTTVVTCPVSEVYTGAAITPCSANVTGVGGLDQALTVDYTANTIVGTVTASATFVGDINHSTSSDSKTFEITKAPSTTTLTCSASKVFAGIAIEPCTAAVTGVGSLSQPITPTYINNVNVGTATANAVYAGDANHLNSSDSKTFTITAKAVTVIADAKSKVQGDADPIFTYKNDPLLFNDDVFTGTLSRVTGETVGTYAIEQGNLSAGANYSITFESADLTILARPILIVRKTVTNNNGGTLQASDFQFTVNNGQAANFETDGENSSSVAVGTYTVREVSNSGYSTTYSNCTNLELVAEQTATCIIANDDIQPKLYVIKSVINDNNGSKNASDFTFRLTGNTLSKTTFNGEASPGTLVTLDAGAYEVKEDTVTSYLPGLSEECSGTIGVGETKTCTVTNNDDFKGPDTPQYMNKSHPTSCTYKIDFKTAEDNGETAKIEVYRSEAEFFGGGNGSKVNTTTIGSNQTGSYTDTVPDCNKSYFYVIRALDNVDNASGYVGDIVSSTPTPTITPATIVGGGSNSILGETVSAPQESVLGAATEGATLTPTTTPEGKVLGQATSENFFQKIMRFISNNALFSFSIFAALIALFVTYLRRFRS